MYSRKRSTFQHRPSSIYRSTSPQYMPASPPYRPSSPSYSPSSPAVSSNNCKDSSCEMSVREESLSSLPIGFETVAEKWGYTEFKILKLSYMWTIKNFSFFSDILWSPTFFSNACEKIKWRLSIEDQHSYISLYLHMLSPDKFKVSAKYKFSILNGERHETNRKILQKGNSFFNCKRHGYEDFIRKDYLLKKENGLLPADELTILCVVEFAIDTFNIVGDSRSVPFKMPELNLNENMENLIDNEKFSDITLAAGGREFSAHKAILTVRSKVFAAMFEHSNDGRTLSRIDLIGISHRGLKEMLHFIYTGKAPNLKEMAGDLLAAADKYALEKLKIMSAESLYNNLSVETVVETLILADLHNADLLKAGAKYFIKVHSTEVMETQAWKNMTTTHSRLVDEVQVFTAPLTTIEEEPQNKRVKIG